MKFAYLEHLIKFDGAIALYTLDDDTASDGAKADSVKDYSDNGFNLTANNATAPLWKFNRRNNANQIEFAGNNDPLKSVDLFQGVKHIFILASYNKNEFAGYEGLFSAKTGIDILTSNNVGNLFFDFQLPNVQILSDGVVQNQNNFIAPVNKIPKLIEITKTDSFAMNSFQIGKQRDVDPARLLDGTVYFVLLYNRILSALEIEKIRLYANLKARHWETTDQTLLFPTPNLIRDHLTTYSHFYSAPIDNDSITVEREYGDGSKSHYEINEIGTRMFDIEMNNLTIKEAQVFDAFAETVKKSRPFNLFDYQIGRTYKNVKIKDYSRRHRRHQSWKNNVKFELEITP